MIAAAVGWLSRARPALARNGEKPKDRRAKGKPGYPKVKLAASRCTLATGGR